jgi:hypothetical protein
MTLAALVAAALAAGAVDAEVGLGRPFLWNGLSGGPYPARTLGLDCGGDAAFFTLAPQLRIAVRGAKPVRLAVRSDGGTVLAVRREGRAAECTATEAPLLEPGLYDIRVGSRLPGLGHPFVLVASASGEEVDMVLPGGRAFTDAGAFFRAALSRHPADERPTSERDLSTWENVLGATRTLKVDFARLPRPARLAGEVILPASGTLVPCPGRFTATPQHELVVPPGTGALRLWVRGPAPLELALRAPGGTWSCAGLVTGETVLDLRAPAAGTYAVHVGAAAAGPHRYSLALVDRTCDARRTRRDPACRPSPPAPAQSAPEWNGMGTTYYLDFGRHAVEAVLLTETMDILVSHGTPARLRAASELLSAVVRLRDEERFVCSATVVEWRGRPAVLTAAHCLYVLDRGRLGPRRARLRAERLPPLDVDAALVPAAFEACSVARLEYSECIGTGAPDVAVVPFRTAPVVGRWWRACAAEPRSPSPVAVFGYGLDRGRLPSELLEGDFVREPGRGRPVALVAADGLQAVAPGDSGGPGVVPASLGSTPEVCYVTSAFEAGDPRLGAPARALVQPAWDLEQTLR